MFYFVQLLPYLFLSSCCVLSSLLLHSFFFLAVANPSARVSVSLSIRPVPFPSTNLLSTSVARRRTLCRLGPERFFFCYFIKLFREREESFYYLDARLQCLADNKPMKATFELEGPLKSPFSPTSRFFPLARSLSLSPFRRFSFSFACSYSHSLFLCR